MFQGQNMKLMAWRLTKVLKPNIELQKCQYFNMFEGFKVILIASLPFILKN